MANFTICTNLECGIKNICGRNIENAKIEEFNAVQSQYFFTPQKDDNEGFECDKFKRLVDE